MATDTQLSEREREILRLIATGATNQRIANELKISINTVKVHIRNIFSKAGVASRAQAVMYAVRIGLVQTNELPPGIDGSGSSDLVVEAEVGAATPDLLSSVLSETGLGVPEETESPSLGDAASSKRDLFGQLVQSPRRFLARRRGLHLRRVWYALFAAAALVLAFAVVATGQWIGREAVPTPLPESDLGSQGDKAERWRTLAPLPAGLSGFALASDLQDGKQLLYVIGGTSGNTVADRILRYDPATDVWVPMSDKPTAVTDVRAAVIGNRIYVPGGRLQSGAITAQLESYDLLRDRWVTLAPLPAPRSGYALAAFEGKLYLLGGWDGKTYRSEVWQYDPDDNAWRPRAPMPVARAFAAAVAMEGRIYVVGGEDETGSLTVNQSYSPTADDQSLSPWSTKAPILSAVGRGDAAAIGGLLMVVGADGAPGRLLLYSGQTDSWRSSQIPLEVLRDLRVQAIGNKLYIVGGSTEGGESAGAYEYQAILTVFVPVIQ